MTYEMMISFRRALDETFCVWVEDVGVLVTCAVRIEQDQKDKQMKEMYNADRGNSSLCSACRS
jgi:hypothetical protein